MSKASERGVEEAADLIRKRMGLGNDPDSYGQVHMVLGYAWMCGVSSPAAKEAGDALADLMREAGMADDVAKAEAWAERRRAFWAWATGHPNAIVVTNDKAGAKCAAEHIAGILSAKKGAP